MYSSLMFFFAQIVMSDIMTFKHAQIINVIIIVMCKVKIMHTKIIV